MLAAASGFSIKRNHRHQCCPYLTEGYRQGIRLVKPCGAGPQAYTALTQIMPLDLEELSIYMMIPLSDPGLNGVQHCKKEAVVTCQVNRPAPADPMETCYLHTHGRKTNRQVG